MKWNGEVIADTQDAYEVKETHHPITFYLPRDSLNASAVSIETIPRYQTMCEWKGPATYHTLTNKATNESVKAKVWTYEDPTPRFTDIKGYLCFYASGVPWECFVDSEKVNPQDG